MNKVKYKKKINNKIYIESTTNSILYTEELVTEMLRKKYKLGFLQGATYASEIFKSKSTTDLKMEVEKLSGDIEVVNNQLKNLTDNIANQNKITNDNFNNLLSKMDDLSHKVEGIDKRTIVLKTSLDYVEKNIDENIKNDIKDIKEGTKDLPTIRTDVNTIKEKNKWWKQFLLAPAISATLSGLIVGIIMLCIKNLK